MAQHISQQQTQTIHKHINYKTCLYNTPGNSATFLKNIGAHNEFADLQQKWNIRIFRIT